MDVNTVLFLLSLLPGTAGTRSGRFI